MDQKRRRALWTITWLSLTLCVPTMAAKPTWVSLGQRVVNDRAEHDTIQVGRKKGHFTKLRLHIDNAPVEVKRVVIHFGNGSKQVIERNRLIGEHGHGPVLDLEGGRRAIDRVVFHYEARSPGWERATIRLLGHRAR